MVSGALERHMTETPPTAAVLLIGDELLSGRTRDINLKQIATYLAPLGIAVRECRTVRDVQQEIVEGVNALRARYTYVFTTGGIGPTHDDITADAIAKAFGVGISERDEVVAFLTQRYAAMEQPFTGPRRRMARIPHGAKLVKNPVSGAPGFQMENVFTLAGVPKIARAMLEDIGPRLKTGKKLLKVSLRGKGLQESDIAEALGALEAEYEGVSLGSYPWFNSLEDRGVALVASGTDAALLGEIEQKLRDLILAQGAEPEKVGV